MLALMLLAGFTAAGAGERKTLRYSGIVQEVNTKAMTLVVVKEGTDLGMLFDASRTHWKNVHGLADLRTGNRVVVEYDAVKARTIAVSVAREGA